MRCVRNEAPSGDRQSNRLSTEWSLYSQDGKRKYLTAQETAAFLYAATKHDPSVYGFCWMIAATGCRISEALALTKSNIDFAAKNVILECLKKRQRQVYRSVPLPAELLDHLSKWVCAGQPPNAVLWPWSRMTGYRRVCEIMREAGLCGPQACPKGLRHSFGVRAIQSGVPLNLVQRWLGHADMKTTAIYTDASGPEEREIASRMWLEPSSARVECPPGLTSRMRAL